MFYVPIPSRGSGMLPQLQIGAVSAKALQPSGVVGESYKESLHNSIMYGVLLLGPLTVYNTGSGIRLRFSIERDCGVSHDTVCNPLITCVSQYRQF